MRYLTTKGRGSELGGDKFLTWLVQFWRKLRNYLLLQKACVYVGEEPEEARAPDEPRESLTVKRDVNSSAFLILLRNHVKIKCISLSLRYARLALYCTNTR